MLLLSVRDQRQSQGRKEGRGRVCREVVAAGEAAGSDHVLKAEAHVHVCKRSGFSQARAPRSFEIRQFLRNVSKDARPGRFATARQSRRREGGSVLAPPLKISARVAAPHMDHIERASQSISRLRSSAGEMEQLQATEPTWGLPSVAEYSANHPLT